MRLLLSATSPFARKVHVVLLEKGIAFEPVYVAPSDPTVTQANPLGKIPALVREDGRALYDSPVIVQYLELHTPMPALLPAEPGARIDALCWEALCDGLCDAVVAGMLERRRPADRQDAGTLAHHEGKVRRALEVMEADLGTRVHAVADAYTLADIAIASALGYVGLRAPALLDAHPALVDRYARLSERSTIACTAPPTVFPAALVTP
ncbi:MAG: glutathione S-transferase N-terminal domain-containing protein [Pseudomonadota bacterium]|nr:glutathione S-transferase N-terminal domain-containing protein [Pseudomonadota bacterium]